MRWQIGGASLVEVLVAQAILLTCLVAGTYGAQSLVQYVRIETTKNALMGSLWLTRHEAVRRNGRVVMCKTAGGSTCASHGEWNQGWMVFHDTDNNVQLSAHEQVLYRESALSAAVRISANVPLRDYVSFGPNGKSMMRNGAFQAGTFTLCMPASPTVRAYEIPLRRAGRTRLVRASLQQCPQANG